MRTTPVKKPAALFVIGLAVAFMAGVPAFFAWGKVGDFGIRSVLGIVGVGGSDGSDSLGWLVLFSGLTGMAIFGVILSVSGVIWMLVVAFNRDSTQHALSSVSETSKKISSGSVEKGSASVVVKNVTVKHGKKATALAKDKIVRYKENRQLKKKWK